MELNVWAFQGSLMHSNLGNRAWNFNGADFEQDIRTTSNGSQ